MKKYLERFKSARGGGTYIEMTISFLVIMMTLAFIMAFVPIFLTKMNLNNIANELCREAEIAGRIGTETDERLERLLEVNPNLNPTVTWSTSGKVNIGETFTVKVSADYDFSFFIFNNLPITLSSKAEGTSEVFWK